MKKIVSCKNSKPTIKASKILMKFEGSHAVISKGDSKRSKSHNSSRSGKNTNRNDLKITSIPYISTPKLKPAWRVGFLYDDDEPLPQISTQGKKISSKIVKKSTEKIAHSQENKRLILSMKFAMNYLQLNNAHQQEIPCSLNIESIEEAKQASPGIDLIFVIDISRHMSGPKLTLAKKTMEFMVSQLGPNNRVCLIIFGDSASRLCPLTCTNENGKKNLIKNINQIGCVILKSEVQKGLSLALNVLALRRYVNSMTSIIFLSDGTENNTEFSLGRFRAILNEDDPKISSPYSIHTFAYGADHDANFMLAMAEGKNGRYYYIENEGCIPRAFSDCLSNLVSVVADHIQVQIQAQACDIPFTLGKIYYETGDSSFGMPPVLSGSKNEAIFTLNFQQCQVNVPDNYKITPVRAIVTYRIPQTGEEAIDQCFLNINVCNEEFLLNEIELDEDVMVNFYRVKGTNILKEALEFWSQRRMDESRDCLARGYHELRSCVVAGNDLIKMLIADIEDFLGRFVDWEAANEGATELKSNIKKFWNKFYQSNIGNQGSAQILVNKKVKDYFIRE